MVLHKRTYFVARKARFCSNCGGIIITSRGSSITLISAHKISKTFGTKVLFKDISLGVESGQKVGLIGPNGSGKSTLIKILAGLEKPDAGQLSLSRGIKISYLAQDPTFTPDETIESALTGVFDDPYTYAAIQATEKMISKLDINQFDREMPVAKMSGGWRKKIALARELLRDPNLLLMDEPTNHLDVESIIWLEKAIQAQTQLATIVVTHDRLFLENVSERIIELNYQFKDGLLMTNGSYSDHMESKDILLTGQLSQEAARRNDFRRETAWLRRGAKARQTKQKARIQSAHELGDEVQSLRDRNRSQKINMELGGFDRSPKKLIEVKDISKSYNDRLLFNHFSLTLSPKSRIGLLGRNGCGKSTLIKILLGEIEPDSGTVFQNEDLVPNFFEQSRRELDPKVTVLKTLCPDGDYVHVRGEPVFGRSYLDRFHFKREQHDMPVGKLSGGEQSRLLIAKLMLSRSHVMILDEPTNDLDISSLDTLKEGLDAYDGAIILVTHDRLFMDQVCDTIWAFPEDDSASDSKELIAFAGYAQWEAWYENRTQEKKDSKKNASSAEEKKSSGGKKLSYKEKRELETLEPQIKDKEARIAALEEKLSSPGVQTNHVELQKVSAEIGSLKAELEKMLERWISLEG